MKENQTFLKPTSRLSSPPSMDGTLRTWFSSDSELPSVVTDLPDSASLMTTNSTWWSTSQTSDWESWPSCQKETQKEKPRNNLKEKLKNPEASKRERSSPPEKYKPRPTSEKLRKITSRNLSDPSVYSIHYLHINFFYFLYFFISSPNFNKLIPQKIIYNKDL